MRSLRKIPAGLAFESWREAARDALTQGYLPDEIAFEDDSATGRLALDAQDERQPSGMPCARPHVPRAFLDQARMVACHRDPERWNLLYRVLWRLQKEPLLLHVEVDDDVAGLHRLQAQVQRDLHKMHAFVRFRKVSPLMQSRAGQAVETAEQFVAWYKPQHRILQLAAPFFAERFSVMQWAILTPDESVNWDPAAKQLQFGPGASAEDAPSGDALEDLWRGYYSAIFNPARLNTQAMRSEMPLRYWSGLPEVAVLPQLIAGAEGRVASMVKAQKEKSTAEPFVPDKHTLPILRAAMPECRGCELYKFATHVVPGAGASKAKLMLVGEQPGDKEDLEGTPFVGPAGTVLRKVIAELGLDPKQIFMTNAVKHFKFVQRGKLRLHQSPRMSEINACRPWLKAEIDAVRPKAVVCLGATAAKSLLGSTFGLMRERGRVVESVYADKVVATIHPSAVLRARDDQSRHQLLGFLKDDLALAYQVALGKM